LKQEILRTRDTGFIPEGMYPKLAGGGTIYDYARSDAYSLERILEVADLASDRDAAHMSRLLTAMDDSHSIVRYWGATGCLILGKQAHPAKDKLRKLLDDEWADVRVVAAEALAHLGEVNAAVATIQDVFKTGNVHEVLAAQNALDFMHQAGLVPLAKAQELVRGLEFSEPASRIPRFLLAQ
jgi:N-sulfoglucosamine sulfohydrolase